jgi:hypothetical protein
MADKSRKPGNRQHHGAEDAPAEPDYDTLLLLERLESLLEEMEELGVSSRAEIEARIEALNQQLDAEER